ncbi:uncharacterized protein LOC142980273 [Anticarsia gemmatalis]|uniref:uncharacterized protein LOC142980273 n=1 Tax=Anticarsia gemmatalis TaxID=129554 RepID=UPI003F75BD21
MKYTLLLLVFYQVNRGFACFGSSGTQIPDMPEEMPHEFYYKDLKGRNKTVFFIPKDKKAEYGRWLINYVLNKREEKLNPTKRPGKIPLQWLGYGEGEGGVEPPPWAIVKEGYGIPDYCFFGPIFGDCNQRWRR